MKIHGFITFATATVFLLASCTKAVIVPLEPEKKVAVPLHSTPPFEKGKLYRVTTRDDIQSNTRDLTVSADSVMFTAEKQYELARGDVKSIERIEVDGDKTALVAIGILAVVGTALYFLVGAFVEGLGGTE